MRTPLEYTESGVWVDAADDGDAQIERTYRPRQAASAGC